MRYRAPGCLPWKSLTTFPPRVLSPTSSTELYSFRIKFRKVKTYRNTGQSTATGRAPLIQEHFLSKQAGPPLPFGHARKLQSNGFVPLPPANANGDGVGRQPGARTIRTIARTRSGCRRPGRSTTPRVALEYVEGEGILLLLNQQGIAASSGSVCTLGWLEPSHVMRAMGIPYTAAHGTIRFSLSRYNTEEEVNRVIAAVPPVIAKLRKLSPYWRGDGPVAHPEQAFAYQGMPGARQVASPAQ
jgi:hypothetical protein